MPILVNQAGEVIVYDGLSAAAAPQPWERQWTLQQIPPQRGARSVAFSVQQGRFIAGLVQGGSNGAVTSPDGKTWTASPASSAGPWESICWAEDRAEWLGWQCSTTASMFGRTADGSSWALFTGSAIKKGCVRRWVAKGLYVAVGIDTKNETYAYKSTAGDNWTGGAVLGSYLIGDVEIAEEIGVAVVGGSTTNSGGSPAVWHSTDATTWTKTQLGTKSGAITGVAWSPSLARFIALSTETSDANGMFSEDGIGWSNFPLPQQGAWGKLRWLEEAGIFIATYGAAGAQELWMSKNGFDWCRSNAPRFGTWTDFAYSPDRKIIVAANDNAGSRHVATLDLA